MIEVKMTDHEFAAWLNQFGKWKYYQSNHDDMPYTNFYDDNDNYLALVIYDNTACTRRIFIKESR